MKSNLMKLVIVVISLNIFFSYIGRYFLPQSESHPPKVVKIEEGISQEDLIAAGDSIVFGRGQCMACHPVKVETGMRAPDIGSIGARLEKEAKEKGTTPEAHAFESLVNPAVYAARIDLLKPADSKERFDPIMPPMHKPPIALNDGEIIAVVAYLQSKGSSVTVSYPASVKTLQEQIQKAGGK